MVERLIDHPQVYPLDDPIVDHCEVLQVEEEVIRLVAISKSPHVHNDQSGLLF
jgi:hypothetical protein